MASTTMTVKIDSLLLAKLNALLADYEREQATIPPTFQVGDWVSWCPFDRCMRTGRFDRVDGPVLHEQGGCYGAVASYRHATAEEIAAATRIVPKVGMLIKRKSDGAVFRVYRVSSSGGNADQLAPLENGKCILNYVLAELSTEAFDILDSYTVQGVR